MCKHFGMSDVSSRRFEALIAKYGMAGLSFEELTHSTLLNVLTTDNNANPESPTTIQVFEAALDSTRIATGGGPSASSEMRATRNPALDGRNKIPGSVVLGIIAVRAHVELSAFADDADVAAPGELAQEVINTLENSIVRLKVGGDRVFEVRGSECMCYGPTIIASTAAAITANADGAIGVLDGVDRQRDVTPVLLGDEQEVHLEVVWDRRTAFSAGFQIRFDLLCQVARKR